MGLYRSLGAVGIQAAFLAVAQGFEERRFLAQGYIIVYERCDNGVLAVRQHQPELAVALREDWHCEHVIYVDVAGAQEIIFRRNDYRTLAVAYSKLAILLEHLMIADILAADAVQIVHHLAAVVDHLQQILERVAAVCHSPREHNLKVQSVDGMAVEVDVVGDGSLPFGYCHRLKPFLEPQHMAVSALHGLYVSMHLPRHLVADELVNLLLFYRINVVGIEIFLCYHVFVLPSCVFLVNVFPFRQRYGVFFEQPNNNQTNFLTRRTGSKPYRKILLL